MKVLYAALIFTLVAANPAISKIIASQDFHNSAICNEHLRIEFFPHLADCRKFIKCVYGKAAVKYCPEGQYWNRILKHCDKPENADCDPLFKNSPKYNYKTSAPSNNPNVRTVCGIPGIEYFPHPTDCDKFIQCVNGKDVVMPCAEGLHWSQILKVCVLPENAGCTSGTNTTTSIPPESTSTSNPESSTPPNNCTTTTEENTTEETTSTTASNSTTGTTSTTESISTTHGTPTTEECIPLPPIGEYCERNPDSEYFPHPTDCDKYIQCVHGKDVIMPCPEGLHWNQNILTCDWPENAECTSSSRTENCFPTTPETTTKSSSTPSTDYCEKNPEDDYFPHPTDCTKYIQCVHGKDVVMPCPEGLHWSVSLEVCDLPENAGCTSGTNTTTSIPPESTSPSNPEPSPPPNNCTTTTEENTTEEITSTTASSSTTETTSTTEIISTTQGTSTTEECTPLPPIGEYCERNPDAEYFPHPTDCDKYIQCVHGKDVIMPCPEGLHWNQNIFMCDFPENAECTSGSGAENCLPTTSHSTTKTTTTPQTDYCEKNPESEYFPHPTDCDKYIQCVHGKDLIMPCPDGLHWSVTLEVCDLPENAGCTSGTNTTTSIPPESTSPSNPEPSPPPNNCTTTTEENTTEEITSTTASSSTTETTSTTEIISTTQGTSTTEECTPLPPIGEYCERNPDAEYFPHPTDCDKYIQCIHGKDVIMPCPEGLHWNQNIFMCDFPENAECTSGSRTENCLPTTSHPTTETTTTPQTDYCEKNPEAEYFPHPTDCDKYIQCVHGKDVIMPCPDGLHWSVTLEVCDLPENAGCTSGTNTTTSIPPESTSPSNPEPSQPPNNCTTTTEENTTEKITSTTASSSTTETSSTTESISTTQGASTTEECTPLPPIGEYCERNPDAEYFPHPTDCDKYIQCVHGEDVIMPCPDGLHWNQNILTCDYPENAECASGSRTENCLPTTSHPTTETTTTPQTDYCEKNPEAEYFPHPTDCDKYIQCVHGKDVIMSCPDGLHWSVSLEVCDLPENAGCTSAANTTTSSPPESTSPSNPESSSPPNNCTTTTEENTTEEITSTTASNSTAGTTSTTEGIPTTQGSSTTEECTPRPPIGDYCARNPGAEYFPHPTDCEKYIQCVHGEDVIMPCPDGLHWNQNIFRCDWPENAECTSGSRTEDCFPTTPDTTTKRSTTPSTGYCEKDPGPGYFPHPTDCNKFIQCVHGKDVIMTCPKGLHWNPRALVCDYPESAGCTSASKTPSNVTMRIFSDKLLCRKYKNSEYLPYFADCNKYIQCIYGKGIVLSCPPKLHWNSAKSMCDSRRNAHCLI